MVILCGARIDENGHAMGGKDGDQNGSEVCRQKYYRHPKKWYVVRPINPKDAEIIAKTAEDLADNANVGYNQARRTTALAIGNANGYDAEAIDKKCALDCSKLVQFCCFAAGIQAGKWNDGFRTGNMIGTMLATGKFVKLTTDKFCKTSINLMRGDILVTRTAGHTMVVISDGSAIKRNLGDRPLTKGAEGPDVSQLQTALKTLGYGKLLGHWGEGKDGVDGDYGNATISAVKAFEKDHGLKIDGTADLDCIKAILSALVTGEPVVIPDDDIPQPNENSPDDTPDPTDGTDVPSDIPEYKCLWAVATTDVNVRTGPSIHNSKKIALYPGTGLMYDGEVKDGFYAVLYRGKRHWVSAKFTKLEVREKYILDISVYDDVKDWDTLKKYVSYVWIRGACRRDTENGEVYIDPEFKKNAKACDDRHIPFGVYVYGRASTKEGGIQEARKVVGWAEPYGPTKYMYDIEAPTLTHASCQGFIDEVTNLTGRDCGIYVGRHWTQVTAGTLRRAFTMCPYYRDNGGGTHGNREPSHPHDMHQYSCSLIVAGKTDPGDVSHINTDPTTNGTGRTIEYFRDSGRVVS